MEAADLLFTRRGEEAADSVWGVGFNLSCLNISLCSLYLHFIFSATFLPPPIVPRTQPPACLTCNHWGGLRSPAEGMFQGHRCVINTMTSAAAAAAVAAQAFLTRRGTGIDTQSRHTTFMREDKQGGGSCLTLCRHVRTRLVRELICPGVYVAMASGHLTFGIWKCPSITACKETLHVNCVRSSCKRSGVLTNDLSGNTCGHRRARAHEVHRTFSSCVKPKTQPTDEEPLCQDKLSDLWGNVVHSLF